MKSKWMIVRYQGKSIGISVLHRETGHKLILFIHGLGCAKEAFELAFAVPGLRKYSLLAADLVGFGDSSKPERFTYRMEDQAGILKALLEEVGFEKVHIVAHSMGGAVGLLLTEQIQGSVGSFTNVEGNLVGEDCGLLSRRSAGVNRHDFFNGVFDEIKESIGRSCREEVLTWLQKSDPLAFYRSAVSLLRWSESGRLFEKFKMLQTRKLYVYGERNRGLSVLARLGSIRRAEIPESGHFIMLDNPRELYREIARNVAPGGTVE
jgi:pimeloyl-ACP methyl ester carboxylesterase